jgi:hypothetical protein
VIAAFRNRYLWTDGEHLLLLVSYVTIAVCIIVMAVPEVRNTQHLLLS